jgi:hypothetical protein
VDDETKAIRKAACMARTATPVMMKCRRRMRDVSPALTVALSAAMWMSGKIARFPQP